jgi:hypothetical protein
MAEQTSSTKFTQFDYLLNAYEAAGAQDNPSDHEYGEKRQALYAYVRELEQLRDALKSIERGIRV